MAAVYPVPDPVTGDMVMLALEMSQGHEFDASAFDAFLGDQRDLGTKWGPRLVRIVRSMPLTANNKVHKPPLRAQKWRTDETVYWRAERGDALAIMGASDVADLEAQFEANSRSHLITAL